MSRIKPSAARQFLIVLAALSLGVLLVPVGAYAAGSFVTIVGPDDSAAEVAGGHLFVTNSAKSPITVRAAQALSVKADSPLPVAGDVGSHPDPGPFHVQGRRQIGRGDRVGVFGPGRHFSFADKVAITSITLSAFDQFDHVFFYAQAGSDCDHLNVSAPRTTIFLFNRVKEGTLHMAFPEPLLVSTPSPGTQSPWCVVVNPAFGPEGISLDVLTVGHVIAT
jgi:hypothetical protein